MPTIRVVGGVLGLLIGLVVATRSLALPDIDSTSRAIAVATAPIGAVIGWLFAVRAVRPGWRSGLVAALGFAAVAVAIGAFAVAGQAAIAANTDASSAIGSALIFGVIGLVFAGLPMFGLVLPIALIWVVALRFVVRLVPRLADPLSDRPSDTVDD